MSSFLRRRISHRPQARCDRQHEKDDGQLSRQLSRQLMDRHREPLDRGYGGDEIRCAGRRRGDSSGMILDTRMRVEGIPGVSMPTCIRVAAMSRC